ncbi:MAG: SPFH domain-containing protein [Candidatus Eisenbacteria bacterium]|uniref:SPFH domain-containing protein n=1 Tax=Eiseniibacteriota bacterium TaxID=2212470 RepID=A0A937XCC1_UNCEI|nr:SPFH domain-containing protein [Candidatus Eisenbacteria bacterium]
MIQEHKVPTAPGIPLLFVFLVLLVGSPLLAILSAVAANFVGFAVWMFLLLVDIFLLTGLFVVNPNEGVVAQLFGRYVGTARKPGLQWVSPFCSRRRVSLRVRNFESGKLKVNDHAGNPIEIAAVVVWRVVDTAEAIFEVDNYEHFVQVQSEAAVRNLATSHPYDAHEEGQVSLRSHTNEVAEQLKGEVQQRLGKAGVEVIESRISHLAYAPEIASAMLQRQQASAIIAARQKIVEGAVGMVEMALDMLSSKAVVSLDEERKAAMVSNLLVVLCSDRHTQPVVNTGTIYQ